MYEALRAFVAFVFKVSHEPPQLSSPHALPPPEPTARGRHVGLRSACVRADGAVGGRAHPASASRTRCAISARGTFETCSPKATLP